MPLYDFECREGHIHEAFVDHGVGSHSCPHCGQWAAKVFLRAPMAFIQKDVHYTSPIDDRPITSMAARREDMARSNCIEYDPEMKTDRVRNIKLADDALDNAVGDTVDATIAAWPVRKREKLAEELASGADVQPTRGTEQ
jgi:hypothetical protein